MKILKNKKISILTMTLSGIFIGVLSIFKLIDNIMPKINGYALWEVYLSITILCIITLPILPAILVILITPLIWILTGQVIYLSPITFILDYSIPMLSCLLIKISKNKWHTIYLIFLIGFIKLFSHCISGKLFWAPNLTYKAIILFNLPFTTITVVISTFITFVLYNRLKTISKSLKLGNKYGF